MRLSVSLLLVFIVFSCTKKTVVFKTDTVTTVLSKKIVIPPVKIEPPDKDQLTTVKVFRDDSVIIRWKYLQVRDTVILYPDEVDCPDCDSVAIYQKIRNETIVTKERSTFGKIFDMVKNWSILIIIAVVLIAIYILLKFIKT